MAAPSCLWLCSVQTSTWADWMQVRVNPECGERQCNATPCMSDHAHTQTHTLFHKLQWHHRWMHSSRYGLIVNPLQMRGLTGGKKGENCLHVFSQQIMEHGESGGGLFERCEHTLGTNIYLEIRPRSSLKDLLHFSCTLYLNGSKGKV